MKKSRMAGVIVLGWLTMVGVDFFLHAGLLAPLYRQPSTFLLPLDLAFNRIPLGYLGILVLAVLLVWLMDRLSITGWRAGLIFGLELGGLMGIASGLGLISITTIPTDLAVAWAVGQTVQVGVGGLVAGSALHTPLNLLWWRVVLLVVLLLAAGIVLQNL